MCLCPASTSCEEEEIFVVRLCRDIGGIVCLERFKCLFSAQCLSSPGLSESREESSAGLSSEQREQGCYPACVQDCSHAPFPLWTERRVIRSLHLLPAEERKCFWREQRMVVVSQEFRKDQGSAGLSMMETDAASLRAGWLEKSLLSAGEDSELKSSP